MTVECIEYIQQYISPLYHNYIESLNVFSPNSQHFSNNNYLQLLLLLYHPFIENILNKKLFPVYANSKMYKDNSLLLPHIDYKYLEYTVTINISESTYETLLLCDINDKCIYNINLNIGDALLFKGDNVYHARYKYNGKPFIQILLHYMSKDNMEKYNLQNYANEFYSHLE